MNPKNTWNLLASFKLLADLIKPIIDKIIILKAKSAIKVEIKSGFLWFTLNDKYPIAIVKTKETTAYFIDNNEFILIKKFIF